MNGWKELTFTVPFHIDGKENWRNEFLRGEYLVRLINGDVTDWFILHAPAKSHKGMTALYEVTCSHVSALLNRKNLFLYFDDTNGIGTAQELMERALANTGWTLGYCETFLERDGKTEKIRTLKAEAKRGAYLLISDICELFSGYPVFHGDTRTVDIFSLNRLDALLELNFGKNLTAVTRKENTENIVTRLYVEGEYGDYGYVGIDDVNPTGLPFLFDFDYYKQIGAFRQEHQDALDRYLADMAVVRAEGMLHAADALALETELIKLWGQIDYVVYELVSGNVTRRITGGNATVEQVPLQAGDELVVLKPGGKHERRTVTVDDPTFSPDDCFAVKFLYKATGIIGGKEVAVEAKEILLEKYRAQWTNDMTVAKREQLRKQIGDTEAALHELYEGNTESEGLYT